MQIHLQSNFFLDVLETFDYFLASTFIFAILLVVLL